MGATPARNSVTYSGYTSSFCHRADCGSLTMTIELKNFTTGTINSRANFIMYGLAVDIAAALKNLRRERGLTQRELAKLCGTSFSAIARWESGNYTGHSLSKLVRIFEALGATVELNIRELLS